MRYDSLSPAEPSPASCLSEENVKEGTLWARKGHLPVTSTFCFCLVALPIKSNTSECFQSEKNPLSSSEGNPVNQMWVCPHDKPLPLLLLLYSDRLHLHFYNKEATEERLRGLQSFKRKVRRCLRVLSLDGKISTSLIISQESQDCAS